MSEPFVASQPDIPNNNTETTTPSVHQGGLGGVSVAGTIAKRSELVSTQKTHSFGQL